MSLHMAVSLTLLALVGAAGLRMLSMTTKMLEFQELGPRMRRRTMLRMARAYEWFLLAVGAELIWMDGWQTAITVIGWAGVWEVGTRIYERHRIAPWWGVGLG